ncbi:DUF1320 domain-containing protein [Acidovorax sp. Root219]|uniref:DUF1320 domain-containing protein n=1 Tax=Acidovorax sp. Root219 TaxID=1736493 RepID=UPI000709C0A5|nr:DUF1320 domain-containing protein [Acidovorax sp. Root219]KRC20168.1 hypothetical protein ASE28_28160 [Acidovorax sp. Root219]
MPYITPLELAERPGAQELSQVASSDGQPLVEVALMDATLRGTDRSAWAPDQVAGADAALARVQDAVAEAGALIDGHLAQGGYALPLDLSSGSAGKTMLTAWARAISRYLLNRNRVSEESKDPVVRDYRDALRLLGQVAQGKLKLGAEDPSTSAGAGSSTDVRFDGAPNVFGRSELRAFR